MANEINEKWIEILDQLLQCPVCLENSYDVAVQCSNGHHICSTCRHNLAECPICKTYFLTTRNILAEQLARSYKDIKFCVLEGVSKQEVSVEKTEVETQSDFSMFYNCIATQTMPVQLPKELSQIKRPSSMKKIPPLFSIKFDHYGATSPSGLTNKQQFAMYKGQQNDTLKTPKYQKNYRTPYVGKGTYPCRIGSCTENLPHGRLMCHLQQQHKHFFYAFNNYNTVFSKDWHLEYDVSTDHDFALHIKNMGVFFLNIKIDMMGNLKAIVQGVNSAALCMGYTFILQIGQGSTAVSHHAKVQTCRIPPEVAFTESLQILNSTMKTLKNYIDNFKCTLTIIRQIKKDGILQTKSEDIEDITKSMEKLLF